MAGTSRTTHAKRQKERMRQEMQAEKAQRRVQRKQEKEGGEVSPAPSKDLVVTYDEEGNPEGLNFHDF